MSENYVIRRARAEDAPLIGMHRARMFHDMGELPDSDFDELRRNSESWIATRLASGEYLGWLIEHAGEVVAGGGLLLRETWPVPGCCRPGRWGYIGNIYTEPQHRRRGLARLIMETILDWCAANNIDHVTLAASSAGRPLYELLGFVPTNDMRLQRR
jgi:GNAT superfamily N-acetyltransferase